MYGFPWDPRLWVAFFVHDLGYWGCPNMDGPEGEKHPYLGANIMGRLFHWSWDGHKWYYFTLLHSHYLAKWLKMPVSKLCAADKLSLCLIPWWLYLPMVRLTGEIREYKSIKKHVDEYGYQSKDNSWADDKAWLLHIRKGVWEKWYAAPRA